MKNRYLKNIATKPINVDEWQRQAVSRSNCYGLLAIVFHDAPTPNIVMQLRTPPLTETLRRLGYDVAQDLAGELEVVTRHLCEQYTKDFVGPGPHVPLYASVHNGDEGRIWGNSTVWVKHFIEMTGLSVQTDWDSIPDHIAIELELMQRLTAHEAQLWAVSLLGSSHHNKNVVKQLHQCLQTQEQFLRHHLCKWIPQFCRRVLEISSSCFYREMTKLTKSVVFSDVEQVTTARNILRCNLFAEWRHHNGLPQPDMNKERVSQEKNI